MSELKEDVCEEGVKARIANLKCPFTWDLIDCARTYHSNRSWVIDEAPIEDMAAVILITTLMQTYEYVMSADMKKGKEIMIQAEDYFDRCGKRELSQGIRRALKYILNSTKCFLLYEDDEMEELELLLNNMVDVTTFTNTEKAALLGCESIAWSVYHDFGLQQAIQTARDAIQLDNEDPLWHYQLAKNIRRRRRVNSIHSAPCDEEKNHFAIAYSLTKNPVIALHYAQMRREITFTFETRFRPDMEKISEEMQTEILQIYMDIYKSKPRSMQILLKLALGFLRTSIENKTLEAEKCLRKIFELQQVNSTWYHYMGMLYEKRRDFKNATKYFKEAASANNYSAEVNYVKYAYDIGDLKSPTEYILKMLKKYQDSIPHRKQELLIILAISYTNIDRDLKKAAERYLEAIEIDPKHRKLTTYFSILGFSNKSYRSSFYYYLDKTFLPQVRNQFQRDLRLNKICDAIQRHCQNHNVEILDNFTKGFRNIKIRN